MKTGSQQFQSQLSGNGPRAPITLAVAHTKTYELSTTAQRLAQQSKQVQLS